LLGSLTRRANAVANSYAQREFVGAVAITAVDVFRTFTAELLSLFWIVGGIRRVRQPQGGQRDTRETDAEFLQRPAARDGLGQALGQFIEFVVHSFPFVFDLVLVCSDRAKSGAVSPSVTARRAGSRCYPGPSPPAWTMWLRSRYRPWQARWSHQRTHPRSQSPPLASRTTHRCDVPHSASSTGLLGLVASSAARCQTSNLSVCRV